MNTVGFLLWLTRGAVVITAGGLLLPIVCRRWRIDSPRTRWLAVLVVFVTALSPWTWTLDIPWYEAGYENDKTAVSSAEESPKIVAEASHATSGSIPPGATDVALVGNLPSTVSTSWLHVDRSLPITFPWPRFADFLPSGTASLCLIWSLGMATVIAVAVLQYVRVVWNCRAPCDSELAHVNEWLDTQSAWTIKGHQIPLRVSSFAGPMLGLLPQGYSLVVPQPLWSSLDATERRLIMRHELAHYLRGDVLATFVLRLIALPFAYHPCAWRLVGLYEEAAEWACDRLAAKDGEALAYARALERLLELQIPETSLALGRCAQSHPLVLRVRRVLKVPESKESRMKTTLFGAALALVAIVSLAQVRLVAEEREATIERVKKEISDLRDKLSETKSKAETVRESGKQLQARVMDRLESLKTLAKDPATWTDAARQRLESLKSTDESKQLGALEGVDKLGDEGIVLCAYALQTIDRESVRRRAMSILCSLGEPALPALAKGFESLAAADRLYAAKELVKHKDKYELVLFARMARDESPEIRAVALEAGLTKGDSLVFLALVADGNEERAKELFEASKKLAGDDLRLLLFAVASKGPPELLAETIRRAAPLKEAAYPIIAEAYQRKIPEARAEIVKLYRKSNVDIEKFVVEEALRDPDETLRTAAENANRD